MRSMLMLPILTIALLVLLTGPSLGGLGADGALAQVARVAVMPTATDLALGETATLEIVIENVPSLWSAQVALAFDPAVVRVVDGAGNAAEAIMAGDLFDPAQTTEFVNLVNRGAGTIEYAASLRNNPRRPVTPASGTGVLARVRFQAVGPGVSTVAFAVEGAEYVREIKFLDGELDEFTLPEADGSLTVTGRAGVYLPSLLRRHPLRAASAEGAGTGAPSGPSSLAAAGPPGRGSHPNAAAPSDPITDRVQDDPQRIVSTNGRLRHVVVHGDFAYWTSGSIEIGCSDGAGEAEIARARLGSGAVEVLAHGCDMNPTALVVDDSNLYYIDATASEVRAFGVGFGSGGHRVETVVAGGRDFDAHSPLVGEAAHLVFADRDGVKRVAKTGGAVTNLAPGQRALALAVDDDHVYWLATLGGDAVRRVRKSGGEVATLYEAETRTALRGMALDGTHVYWTEQGGVARRVPKTGGEHQVYGVAGSWQAGAIAVSGADVFWSDEVRLRRAPKGGGAPEALLLSHTGIRDLQVAGAALYWGGGPAAEQGVWSLPLGASEVTVDLRITAMEVTQAIQNLAHDVPLVAGKPTLVRLFPASDGAYTHDVPARLRAFRGGVELADSPILPLEPTLSVRSRSAERGRLEETYNFLLPREWTQGTLELRAEINPDGSIREANLANNQRTQSVTFQRRDAMCLEMIRVHTAPRSYSTREASFGSIMDAVASMYPVPGLRIRTGGTIHEPQWCRTEHGLPYLCRGPYEMPDDSDWVLSRIWWYNLWDANEAGCDTTFYVGMVHPDGIDRNGTIGTSYVGGRELWAMMDSSPTVLGGAFPWFLPFGGPIVAHELGHSLDRRHVDCGGPDAGSIQAGYPYNRCDIGHDDPAGYYGTDVLDMAVIRPTVAGDLMSYAHNAGKPAWPSDWTYRALMGGLPGGDLDGAPSSGGAVGAASGYVEARGDPGAAGDLVTAVMQSADNLAVTGVVTPTDGTAAIVSAMVVPDGLVHHGRLASMAGRLNTGPGGRYTLQLRDAAGSLVRQVQFDPPEQTDAPAEARSYQMILPYDASVARAVLSEGGVQRAARDASASPPSVRVVRPNGGETVTGPLDVEWEADDPDGDPLLFTLQYSADAGASWQPLAIDAVATTWTVDDMSSIPGSDRALVRVIASDGMRTASDTSDATFRVARQAPLVTITRPDDGVVVMPGARILATGQAYDAEDGTIDSEGQLRWFVDGAPVATGSFTIIPAPAEGEHTLTLRATDSDNQQGESSITLHVQRDPCANANNVDVLFLLDTSPAMDEQLDAACRAVKESVAALAQAGLGVRHLTLGVTQSRACAQGSVRGLVAGSAADHPADWGVAVREMARGYKWQSGATRLIVVFTNQGPENGDPVEDPGADRDVVEAAVLAARAAGVKVVPILALTGLGPQPEPPDLPIAHELAHRTGGKALALYNAMTSIGTELLRMVPRVSCLPNPEGVSPSCGFDSEDTLTLHGHNLTVGTQVYVGSGLARGTAVNAAGTRLTFQAPSDLIPGRTYDIRVERAGVGGRTLPGAVTFGACADRCDGYEEGDITVPMWRIRSDQGEVVFEAKAAGGTLRARVYAHDGPVKVLMQQADGTAIASKGVPTGATGDAAVDTVPGRTYRVVVRNAHAPPTRFRLYVHGADYLRTADDGDDWLGPPQPGRGENMGVASHPELGFAGRWTDLGPQFAATTWHFQVAPSDGELAVRAWSEGLFGLGHAGMSWLRPDGSVQPLVGPVPAPFDHTWTVERPQPGLWGLRIESLRSGQTAAQAAGGEAVGGGPRAAQTDEHTVSSVMHFTLGYQPQGYSLARLDQPADDWVYLLADSMLGPPCGPTLALVPGHADLCVGGLRRMDIVLADVANVYAAEVHLAFDKDRLEAVDESGRAATQITPGAFLDPAKGILAANAVDNEYGLIDYAVTLRDPAEPAFGTGVLGSVWFKPRAAGEAKVEVDEVKLSERPLPPTPARRVTAAARAATYAATDCYGEGQSVPSAIRGRAILDGREDHSGADVRMAGGGRTLTGPEGRFDLTALAPGERLVDVRMDGYLRAGERSFTLASGAVLQLPTATLLGGDCNASDAIDIADGGIAARYFGLTGGWPAGRLPDINADGVVDIYDLVMIGGNFGCRLEDDSVRCRRWGRTAGH